jgi:hypothetical protein
VIVAVIREIVLAVFFECVVAFYAAMPSGSFVVSVIFQTSTVDSWLLRGLKAFFPRTAICSTSSKRGKSRACYDVAK